MKRRKRFFDVVLRSLVFVSLFVAEVEICAGADELIIGLQIPKKSTEQLKTVKPISSAEIVSGDILLDISPYPQERVKGRYLAEYFLDGKLLYSTNGYAENGQNVFSFKYVFDTTKFPNGRYKIYVNFWDMKGVPAVGGKRIVINNQDSSN